MSKTIIDTSRFYRSHLKNPRGGSRWLFEDKDGNILFTIRGAYGQAKKEAQQRAADQIRIYVSP